MFIPPNEGLIIMDDVINPLLTNEFMSLAGAGVRTVYMQMGFMWDKMQPEPGGPINWDRLDNFVSDCRKSGIKGLVPVVGSLPAWKPDNWYYMRYMESRSISYGIASYTNPQTGADLDALVAEAIARYNGADIQFIYGMPADGEFPIDFWPVHSEIDIPHKDFINFVVERQKLLVLQSNEVWTSFHPYTQPPWWDELYRALRLAFPESIHRQIVFTYFPHDHSNPAVGQFIGRNIAAGDEVFVGSEWVTGLRHHMRYVKPRGLRGFLTCPNHFTQHDKRITPWQLEEIEWAVREFEANAAV